jgi:4-hydroxy-tetrahydrodipicolinate synthase
LIEARATAIRWIFEALPMIPAMKHAIAHWLNDDQWRTVRPPFEHLEPMVAARLIEQLTAVGPAVPGASQLDSMDAYVVSANWNPTGAEARYNLS